MSIFVNKDTKVIYQGLTGRQGSYYGGLNKEYGTQVVAGTHPKKAGTDVDGVPVYATVAEAVEATGATASCIFIPAPGVKDAVMEAAEGGVEFIVAITEGVPAHDEAYFYNKLKRDHPNVQLLGPNCQQKDIGVTTCVGIGGDPVPGTSFIDCLKAFEADPDTKAIMMIGEIGGSAEEEAAEFIKANVTKPVSSYVAGVTAPPGKKMGHAGAIVSGGKGTAAAKMEALRDAGVHVGLNPTEAGAIGRPRTRFGAESLETPENGRCSRLKKPGSNL